MFVYLRLSEFVEMGVDEIEKLTGFLCVAILLQRTHLTAGVHRSKIEKKY